MTFAKALYSAYQDHRDKQGGQGKEPKPFVIGARFTSGVPMEILRVESADSDEDYILARIKLSNGTFSETIRTYNTATIEFFEVIV